MKTRLGILSALAVLLGIPLGLGLFTFSYGEGLAYFSHDPKVCVNCHVMNPEYDSWQKSPHYAAAVCADCHLPKKFFPTMVAEADNGYRHSKGFTFEDSMFFNASAARLQHIADAQQAFRADVRDYYAKQMDELASGTPVPTTGPAGPFGRAALELTETEVRIGGRALVLPATPESLAAHLGKPSRTWQGRNTIHVWDDLGLLAYERPGSGRIQTLAVAINPARWDYWPKTLYQGPMTLLGKPADRLATCWSLDRKIAPGQFKEWPSAPGGTLALDGYEVNLLTESDGLTPAIELSFDSERTSGPPLDSQERGQR